MIEADHPTHDRLVFPLSARTRREDDVVEPLQPLCTRTASGIDHFILHDLRRTFSTLMAENTNVSETIIDSLLNHKQSATRGGVIRHYQQAKHLETRRERHEGMGQTTGGVDMSGSNGLDGKKRLMEGSACGAGRSQHWSFEDVLAVGQMCEDRWREAEAATVKRNRSGMLEEQSEIASS